MLALDEHVALGLIEQGSRLAALDRAVLLAATLGGVSGASAAAMPIDRRDRVLIDARLATFGRDIAFFARCPHCDEGNEADFDLAVLPEAAPAEGVVASVGGREVVLRAPNSATIARAVMNARPDLVIEDIVDADARSDDPAWRGEVEDALAGAFPLLDVRFELTCGACESTFDVRFDIVAWLWREIETVASRAIDTVDRLARAYGWSEREILALSPARRGLYIAKLAS